MTSCRSMRKYVNKELNKLKDEPMSVFDSRLDRHMFASTDNTSGDGPPTLFSAPYNSFPDVMKSIPNQELKWKRKKNR
ncbi:hypothetical protein J6590_010418 [Homalodisca vitripennis]|nr:hypothetical protein J6590_010418 [Homalodisca vitripennis]